MLGRFRDESWHSICEWSELFRGDEIDFIGLLALTASDFEDFH